MPNILLVDDSEVASRAMKGILARGSHRCVVATTAEEAMKQLKESVKIDLVFTELQLSGEDGVSLLQRIRAHPLLKLMPVVAYTHANQQTLIKKVLNIGVQNYLMKPYHDEAIHQEIQKCSANPWRNLHFEEEKSFCKLMGLSSTDLAAMRDALRVSLEENAEFFSNCADVPDRNQISSRLSDLSEAAEAAGVWGVVEYLDTLKKAAQFAQWEAFRNAKEDLLYAARFIYCHLHPIYVPDSLFTEAERQEAADTEERQLWESADVDAGGPLREARAVEFQLDALSAVPTMDNVAASFLMACDTKSTHLTHLMDLVSKDPGLSAQVLIAANQLEKDTLASVEDPRVAVGLLGNLKLSALARTMPTIAERHMNLPPITWAQFWTFQVAVGQLAQFSCTALELDHLAANAYTAGLLHDLGKFLLVKLYPFGFPTMVKYAQLKGLTLQEAELKYISLNTQDMGAFFAQKHGLPRLYTNVIRWVNTPAKAEADREMVAAVSLARHICRHNHVGYCGDTPKDACPPLEETEAWSVLRESVYPSFDLRAFETQAQTFCHRIKEELAGRAG